MRPPPPAASVLLRWRRSPAGSFSLAQSQQARVPRSRSCSARRASSPRRAPARGRLHAERLHPRQPAPGDARSRLGAGLPRPVLRRLDLRVHVRAERHAQLPAARPREERRRRPDQPDLRLRQGDRPLRQPGVAPLGPAHLPEGPHPQPPLLRRPPGEGADDPQGLQGVGRGRLPAQRGRLAEVRPEPPRHGRLDQALLGRRDGDRREDARERRPHLQRRGRRGEAARAGLRPGHGRGDARRGRAGDQDARRHAAARCRPHLRLLPLRQHAGAARREGAAGRALPRRSSAAAPSTTTPGTPTCRPATRW